MNIESWKAEPFLKSIELPRRQVLLLELIDSYLKYRNITNTDIQKANMAEMISKEVTNYPYLKLRSIREALHKKTDPNNSNVSAAGIMAMIKSFYGSEEHKAAVNDWFESEKNNHIQEVSESSKEELNKKCREEGFNKCVEQVKEGNINLDNVNWTLAVLHLQKDIKLELTKEQRAKYEDQAINIVLNETKKILNNEQTSRNDRNTAARVVSELLDNKFDQDTKAKITNVRQKLICKSYIEEVVLIELA